MAHLLPRDPGGFRRLTTHGFALAAVLGVALTGAMTAAPAPALEAQTSGATDPLPAQTQDFPAQPARDLVALPPVPTSAPTALPAAAGQQQATATFNPRNGLPMWLRTVRDTPLWTSADSTATSTGTLAAATSYVKPLGPIGDSRLEVYFPGDDAQPAAQAWVDTTNVEPSGIPPWISPPPPGDPGLEASPLPAPPQRTGTDPVPDTTAVHIAIVDDDSGQLIYGEQPYTEVPEASTTKVATAIVALEHSPDLSRTVNVTVSASAMVARDGSSTMGIEPGETLTMDTLMHGMLLPSGNDAAEQVAIALADSRQQYVDWMNQEAAALGLKDTHFANPSGMDEAGHYSSAYDMAMLSRYAMHNATFRDLVGTKDYTSQGFQMTNLNRLLGVYPGVDGVKIGYTDGAQKTMIASVVHNGHRVFVSVMRSEDLPGDCTLLFNWVWDNFTW